MSITMVGTPLYGRSSGSNTNPLTMTLPTHQADDFGIIIVMGDGTSGTPTISISGASGWTEYSGSPYVSGVGDSRFMEVWYKRFESSSEATPVVNTDVGEQHSAALYVLRGVSIASPFDTTITEDEGADTFNPTNAQITTVKDGSAIIVAHYPTDNDHGAAVTMGAPSGYTLGPSQNDALDENFAGAYLLNAGAAGLKSPGAWTHSGGSAVTTDYTVLTIALRDVAQDIPDPPYTSVTVSG